MEKVNEREFWCEFLEIYKEEPSLWKIKSPEYSNRVCKANAYSKLIEKLKEINPEANRELVVKKINTFRTNFRKELKKVRQSEKSGAGQDDVYVPSLWYFSKLFFLEDQEDNTSGRSTIDIEVKFLVFVIITYIKLLLNFRIRHHLKRKKLRRKII